MFSTAKKVELQFAIEAAKCEPLTFEDYLGEILLHMFPWRSKASFLRPYANDILIEDATSGAAPV